MGLDTEWTQDWTECGHSHPRARDRKQRREIQGWIQGSATQVCPTVFTVASKGPKDFFQMPTLSVDIKPHSEASPRISTSPKRILDPLPKLQEFFKHLSTYLTN